MEKQVCYWLICYWLLADVICYPAISVQSEGYPLIINQPSSRYGCQRCSSESLSGHQVSFSM